MPERHAYAWPLPTLLSPSGLAYHCHRGRRWPESLAQLYIAFASQSSLLRVWPKSMQQAIDGIVCRQLDLSLLEVRSASPQLYTLPPSEVDVFNMGVFRWIHSLFLPHLQFNCVTESFSFATTSQHQPSHISIYWPLPTCGELIVLVLPLDYAETPLIYLGAWSVKRSRHALSSNLMRGFRGKIGSKWEMADVQLLSVIAIPGTNFLVLHKSSLTPWVQPDQGFFFFFLCPLCPIKSRRSSIILRACLTPLGHIYWEVSFVISVFLMFVAGI